MKIKKIIIFSILAVMLIAAAVFVFLFNDTIPEDVIPANFTVSAENKDLSLLSFNIQVFGTSKMSNKPVVDILVDIVSKYDISAIQEVRDSSGLAVVEFMKLLPLNYKYVLGPREGRTSSKEQYLFIYDSSFITVKGEAVYPDTTDIFERNPYAVYFQCGDFDFVLINKHVSPGAALKEITAIPDVVSYFKTMFNELDIITVGDFNADGSYFNEYKMAEIFNPTNYNIIIDNSFDTTIGESAYTYDRIIITSPVIEDYTGEKGVYIFENNYDFLILKIQPKQISDHYPVWANFYINKDTD